MASWATAPPFLPACTVLVQPLAAGRAVGDAGTQDAFLRLVSLTSEAMGVFSDEMPKGITLALSAYCETALDNVQFSPSHQGEQQLAQGISLLFLAWQFATTTVQRNSIYISEMWRADTIEKCGAGFCLKNSRYCLAENIF